MTITIGGADVCNVLGYQKPKDALQRYVTSTNEIGCIACAPHFAVRARLQAMMWTMPKT
jgi:hypothetical protein